MSGTTRKIVKIYKKIIMILISMSLILLGCQNSITSTNTKDTKAGEILSPGEIHNKAINSMYSHMSKQELIIDNDNLGKVICEEFSIETPVSFDNTIASLNDFGATKINITANRVQKIDNTIMHLDNCISISNNEKALINQLLTVLKLEASDSLIFSQIDSLYTLGKITEVEKYYPIYYTILDIAKYSSSYWTENIDSWASMIKQKYNGEIELPNTLIS